LNTLISPQDHWAIWAVLLSIATMSIILEQKSKIAAKITGPVIALVGGMLLSNLCIIPTKATSYDIIWEYIVPLAIPLLLIKIDIRQVFKETGRLFGAFHLSALGTMIGGFLAVFLFHKFIPEIAKIAGVMNASYIGGGVNFVAMVSTFQPSESLVNATLVADSMVMVLYFLILISMPGLVIVRKIFPLTQVSQEFYKDELRDGAKSYWKAKPISLLNISLSLGIAFVIATVSVKISSYFGSAHIPIILRSILGQKYLVLTTLSIVLPFFFPKLTNYINGSDELGTFFIYIFFVILGVPASFKAVIKESPVMLLFCAVMIFMNFLVTFGLGKILKFELEELILVGLATTGGPMTAAAIAIAKGWKKLIFPSFLVGIWGYLIGTYIGYLTGMFLLHIFK